MNCSPILTADSYGGPPVVVALACPETDGWIEAWRVELPVDGEGVPWEVLLDAYAAHNAHHPRDLPTPRQRSRRPKFKPGLGMDAGTQIAK